MTDSVVSHIVVKSPQMSASVGVAGITTRFYGFSLYNMLFSKLFFTFTSENMS